MNILAQFPTYKRPEKLLRTLSRYVEQSSGDHNIFFNINADNEDFPTQRLVKDVTRIVYDYEHVDFSMNFNDNTDKISAVNGNIDVCGFDFDVVIVISDDMTPVKGKNWDAVIAENMEKYFPTTFGALHFPDGNRKDLITFSILGKRLYEHFGYIYHPDYKALYCDDEFTQVVKDMGVYKFIDEQIVNHDHYAQEGNENSGEYDEAANRTIMNSGRDQVVYMERKKRGFPRSRITV